MSSSEDDRTEAAMEMPESGSAVAREAVGGREPIPPAQYGIRHMFDSLRYRDYRILWIGQMSWYTSLTVETMAQNWVVWTLTGSALNLALINLVGSVTRLAMTLPAGVAADRFNKKTILVWCQLVTFSSYLIITVLVVGEWVRLWHVYTVAMVLSFSSSFNLPTRQSLVPRLVPREMVLNAFSLNQVALSSTRAISPALAGFMIGWWPLGVGGAGSAYAFGSAVFVVVVVTTFMLPAREGAPVGHRGKSAVGQVMEGLGFVAHSPVVFSIMVVAAVTMAFGMSYVILLPVVADEMFDIGARGYGLLTAVGGIGALVGGVGLASMGNMKRRGLVFLGNSLAFGIFNVLLGVSAWVSIALAFAAMFALGAGASLLKAVGQTLVLQRTPEELQGRVMSVYHLDRGLMPLGSVVGGVLADAAGGGWALIFLGGTCVTGVAIVVAVGRTLRNL